MGTSAVVLMLVVVKVRRGCSGRRNRDKDTGTDRQLLLLLQMSDYFRVLRLPDTDNDSSVQLCPKWQLQLLLAAVLKIILPMLLPSPSPLLSVSEQVCACVLAKESVKNTHSFFFFFFLLCCCCCLILSDSGGGRSRCASLLNQGAQCVFAI